MVRHRILVPVFVGSIPTSRAEYLRKTPMNIKLIFAILSALVGISAFYPYFRDISSKKTHPHEFTWLIWAITQGTATAALWIGGGGVAAIPLTISTLLVVLVFLFSIPGGDRYISRSDYVVLVISFLAIIIWWLLDNPLISVLLLSAIDVFGYIPTFRKSYHYPWSETLLSWGTFTVANILSIFAIEDYNFITMTYIVSISLTDLALLIFLIFRRKKVINNALR